MLSRFGLRTLWRRVWVQVTCSLPWRSAKRRVHVSGAASRPGGTARGPCVRRVRWRASGGRCRHLSRCVHPAASSYAQVPASPGRRHCCERGCHVRSQSSLSPPYWRHLGGLFAAPCFVIPSSVTSYPQAAGTWRVVVLLLPRLVTSGKYRLHVFVERLDGVHIFYYYMLARRYNKRLLSVYL